MSHIQLELIALEMNPQCDWGEFDGAFFIHMAKDPAFLFYPNDWLGGTMGMTFEEKGAYMELLMLQFNRGHMTKHMIGQTIGQLWESIQDKFIQDEKGLWYNERLDIEKEKRKTFTESRRNNINGKNQHNSNGHMKGHTTSHMENENVNRNESKNINRIRVIDEQFEEFWNLYDYKKSKEKAEKVWKTLTTEEKNQAIYHAPLYAQSTPDKTYRKHPTTYLNQKSFNDEIIQRVDPTSHKPNASERRFKALAALHYVENGSQDI